MKKESIITLFHIKLLHGLGPVEYVFVQLEKPVSYYSAMSLLLRVSLRTFLLKEFLKLIISVELWKIILKKLKTAFILTRQIALGLLKTMPEC